MGRWSALLIGIAVGGVVAWWKNRQLEMRRPLTVALVAGFVGALIALFIASPLDELLIVKYLSRR